MNIGSESGSSGNFCRDPVMDLDPAKNFDCDTVSGLGPPEIGIMFYRDLVPSGILIWTRVRIWIQLDYWKGSGHGSGPG